MANIIIREESEDYVAVVTKSKSFKFNPKRINADASASSINNRASASDLDNIDN